MELWKIYDKDGNYTGMKVDKDNMFMRNRWEFVRDEIKELIESKN